MKQPKGLPLEISQIEQIQFAELHRPIGVIGQPKLVFSPIMRFRILLVVHSSQMN